MADDLNRNLRSLAKFEHADLSIGDEAADAIERQAAEITRLQSGGCARDQTTTQYCAEAVGLAAEVAELRAEVERLRALTTWRPISEAPHAVRPAPIDLYHVLFGRIPDCYWHQLHGWVRIARGDRGYAPIEHQSLLTHYTPKPAPPAPESSDA